MASFDLCFSFLLPNEDTNPPQYKEVSDPTQADPNARAIAGVNSHFWPDDYPAIAAILQSERGPAVKDFYQRRFWNTWLAQLTSNKLAAMTLDAGVNQGAGWACKFVQTACGVPVDGKWGPNTLAAANGTSLDVVIPGFVEARQVRYRAVGGPSLDAWLARAAKVPEFD